MNGYDGNETRLQSTKFLLILYNEWGKRDQANLLVLERRILPEEPLPVLAGGFPLYCRFPNPVRAGKISLLL